MLGPPQGWCIRLPAEGSHRAPSLAKEAPDAGDDDVRRDTTSPDLAEALLGRFADAGYARIAPPVLQPAEVFIDLSGEDIRRRMFVTTNAMAMNGRCGPSSPSPSPGWLAAGAGDTASFSYCGPVFRLRPGETGEFVQAGIESFGRSDAEAADAEVLALALEAVEAAGLARPEVRVGDVGLFTALVGALDLRPRACASSSVPTRRARSTPPALDDLSNGHGLAGEHAGSCAPCRGRIPAQPAPSSRTS